MTKKAEIEHCHKCDLKLEMYVSREGRDGKPLCYQCYSNERQGVTTAFDRTGFEPWHKTGFELPY